MLETLSSAAGVAGLLSALALVAVWIPFQRGLRVCVRASAATRRIPPSQLRLAPAKSERTASLTLLMLQVLRQALRDGGDQPPEFLLDATRQYVVGEWERHYAGLISMYANILPPIGFIGTTGGLLVLFLSRRLEDASLEIGALAVALVSSVLALVAFAVLESLKIRLYGRLLVCLEDVTALFHAKQGEASRVRRAATQTV
jgi:hypothetical protein